MADNLLDLSQRADTGTQLRQLHDQANAIAVRVDRMAADLRAIRDEILADPDVFTVADRTTARDSTHAALLVLLQRVALLDDLVVGSLSVQIDGVDVGNL